jgi:transposase
MVSMNRLTKEERIRVIAALVEGNSIRATARMTGGAKNTVIKLLVDIGHPSRWATLGLASHIRLHPPHPLAPHRQPVRLVDPNSATI